jgi:formylglycine-generating enzyme required for sulfatase activity
MGESPSIFKGDDLPVEFESWDDCQDFCQKTGLKLPTEAQWEYACRAGSTVPYSFGQDEKMLSEYAWYDANSNGMTHTVGEKRPNDFGLHDAHGNVWEWCEDGPDIGFYGRADAGGLDPVCHQSPSYREFRGGDFMAGARMSRCAVRNMDGREYRIPGVGLRPAYPLP